MSRQTIKSMQEQINTLRELRKGDQDSLANLNRRCAEHEARFEQYKQLRNNNDKLWQLVEKLVETNKQLAWKITDGEG